MDISPRKTYTWPRGTWKMFNIINYYWEMQIKTIMRESSPHTGQRAMIKKSANNKCWRECGERGTFLRCWSEHELAQPQWKSEWSFLKKLKIELPYDPAISLENHILPKKTLDPNVHCSTTYNSQDIEANSMSIDEWIKKIWYILHNGILLSH